MMPKVHMLALINSANPAVAKDFTAILLCRYLGFILRN